MKTACIVCGIWLGREGKKLRESILKLNAKEKIILCFYLFTVKALNSENIDVIHIHRLKNIYK